MTPIDSEKLNIFEHYVLESLKAQPPSAYDREFILDDREMKLIVKRTSEIYNKILLQDVTIIEKHLMIVTTIASLVCEKAFLEQLLSGVVEAKNQGK